MKIANSHMKIQDLCDLINDKMDCDSSEEQILNTDVNALNTFISLNDSKEYSPKEAISIKELNDYIKHINDEYAHLFFCQYDPIFDKQIKTINLSYGEGEPSSSENFNFTKEGSFVTTEGTSLTKVVDLVDLSCYGWNGSGKATYSFTINDAITEALVFKENGSKEFEVSSKNGSNSVYLSNESYLKLENNKEYKYKFTFTLENVKLKDYKSDRGVTIHLPDIIEYYINPLPQFNTPRDK